MGKLIDGKLIAETILTEVTHEVQNLILQGKRPHLGIILVGNNPASEVYVRRKQAAAERVGIIFSLFRFPAETTQNELIQEIKRIQQKKRVSGLIVQLPIPEHLYTPDILNAVDPAHDVDCLTDVSVGRLAMNTQLVEPPTAGAVMEILRFHNVPLAGKNITLVGMGALVGKPLALLFINARASVTTTNSLIKPLSAKTKTADIIVSGVGKQNLVKGTMVKQSAIVIDAGIAFDKNGKVVGDVHLPSVQKKARLTTPTPGGVGPITVALLLRNTIILHKKKSAK